MWRLCVASISLFCGLALTPAVSIGGSADSTGLGGMGSGGADRSFWEAHPKYELKIAKQKDVTNWNSNISLAKPISDRISLVLNATLTTRENSTLNRSDASDATSAALQFKANDNVTFGINYNSGVDTYKFDLKGKGPVERKRRYDVTVSSNLNKRLYETISLTMKTTAGTTRNSFTTVSNKGSKLNLSTSVSFTPNDKFRTAVTYTGSRLLLDSELQAAADSVFKSEDRTFSQNLGVSLDYQVLPGVHLGLDASNNDERKQHPDPAKKTQETEERSSSRAAVTSSFDFIKRVTWDLSVSMNSSKNRFIVNSNRKSNVQQAALNASAKVIAWRGATINLGGAREDSRSEYVTTDTGDNLHKSLSFKLSQNLGSRADLSVTALSDLVSVVYDEKEANDNDRDRLDNRADLELQYRPFANVSTRFGGAYSVEKSIYVMSSQSGNNKTDRRYRVFGSYDLKTIYNISVSQNYDIGANYTLYHYVESNNTLVRNSNISTSFRIPVTPILNLNVAHNYKFQDQGSYKQKGHTYGISAETESHLLSLSMDYRIFKLVNFSVTQSYFLQQTWAYDRGQKTLDYETRYTDISGRMGFQYDFKERTKISFSVAQNRTEGSRVSSAFKKYWNVELEGSHVF